MDWWDSDVPWRSLFDSAHEISSCGNDGTRQSPCMPVVRFTQNLKRHVDCQPRRVEGATVREALDAVFKEVPALRSYVLNDQGAVHPHVAIMVNGLAQLDRSSLTGSVGDNDEIFVMQALSGG